MSIDLVILCVFMALYIGWKASAAWHIYTFRTILEDLKIPVAKLKNLVEAQSLAEISEDQQADHEDLDLPILEVRVEKHPEGLFAYRKEDGFFIAQGKDRDTLMENLVNNLTNVRVIVHKEDGAELINPKTSS
jgi:hypothetical protein